MFCQSVATKHSTIHVNVHTHFLLAVSSLTFKFFPIHWCRYFFFLCSIFLRGISCLRRGLQSQEEEEEEEEEEVVVVVVELVKLSM